MKRFEWSLRLKGFPIKEAKKTLHLIESYDEKAYANFLSRQLRSIVQFHLENTPFYHELCKGIDTNNWNELPVLTKTNLKQT